MRSANAPHLASIRQIAKGQRTHLIHNQRLPKVESGLPNSDQWSIRTRAWLADDVHTAGSVNSSFTVDSTAIGSRVSVQGELTCTDEQIKRKRQGEGELSIGYWCADSARTSFRNLPLHYSRCFVTGTATTPPECQNDGSNLERNKGSIQRLSIHVVSRR